MSLEQSVNTLNESIIALNSTLEKLAVKGSNSVSEEKEEIKKSTKTEDNKESKKSTKTKVEKTAKVEEVESEVDELDSKDLDIDELDSEVNYSADDVKELAKRKISDGVIEKPEVKKMITKLGGDQISDLNQESLNKLYNQLIVKK